MTNQCITKSELAEFTLGKLDGQRSESIASHIDCCASCQDTVVALAESSDTFVAGIGRAHMAEDDPIQDEDALQLGLRRVVSSIRQTSDSVLRSSFPREELAPLEEIGPYSMVSCLGIGGMGAVYRARHQKLKRDVAIKLLPNDRWPNTDVVNRFEREMEAIGQLDHPNIVRASDAGEENGMHYLVMEYVDGLDLSRLVRRVGRLAVADACELVRQTAVGLHYAHDNRLIHRDIKPSNLILGWTKSSGSSESSKPTVKILDLGLALLGEECLHNEHDLTTVGQLMGTLDYMSPEQGLDSHDVDNRTDIFSLGATLFKLLTGKAPLEANSITTPLKKLTSLATKQLPSIATIRDDLPEDVVAVVDKMLARDPDDRFATAQEVAEALESFCAKANLNVLLRRGLSVEEDEPPVGVGVSLSRLPQPEARAVRRQSSFRRWVAFALVAAMVVIGGFVIYLETGKGRIRIDAKVPDVDVEIRKSGRVVDTIEIEHMGSNDSTRIRAGTYELVLKNAGDDIRLSQGAVTVSRGGMPTVTVTREESRVSEKNLPATSISGRDSTARSPSESAGFEISICVDTKKTPVEKLKQNIGYSNISLMADGVAKRVSDGKQGPATLALAHGCRLMRFQQTNARVVVGLEIPTRETAPDYRDLNERSIQNLKGLGYTFWLDHLDNDPVRAINPDYSAIGEADGDVVFSPTTGWKSDEKTYDGRTFSEWLAELKTERKAENMLDAVVALHRLHNDGDSEAVIKQMLGAMRVYGSLVEDSSPQGRLVKAVRESLNDMPPGQVYEAVVDEIRSGNAKSRAFLGWFFAGPGAVYTSPVAEYIGMHPEKVGKALIEFVKAEDEVPTTRLWALESLVKLCGIAPGYAPKNEDVLQALRLVAKSEETDALGFGGKPLRFAALELLATHSHDREIVDLLIQLTNSNEPYHRLWAVQALQKLGPHAVPAIPRLLSLLRAEFDAGYPFQQLGVGYMGSMGVVIGGMGGMGGGMGGAGGGMGGGMAFPSMMASPGAQPLYQSTSPGVRIEIVKCLEMMGDQAAPAIPGLLEIMEHETRIERSDVDPGGGQYAPGSSTGVVIRMTIQSGFKNGPPELLANDFMVRCFNVIKNCHAREAIPLLTKFVNAKEHFEPFDYAEAPWRSDADKTLKLLDPSDAKNDDINDF